MSWIDEWHKFKNQVEVILDSYTLPAQEYIRRLITTKPYSPYVAIGDALTIDYLIGWSFMKLKDPRDTASTFLIEVEENSLPETIVEEVAKTIISHMAWSVKWNEDRFKRGEYIHPYISHYVITLMYLYRNKESIDQAVKFYNEIIEEIKKHGKIITHGLDLWISNYPEGRVTVKVLGSRYEIDRNKFNEIMRKKPFNETRNRDIGELYIKRFNNVEVIFDIDRNNYGISTLMVQDIDLEKRVEELNKIVRGYIYSRSIIIENIKFNPLALEHIYSTDQIIYVRKVQRIGGKLALYLTEPLIVIGVREGQEVQITVNPYEKEIKIKPAKIDP